jgi:hypothetical protein
VSQEPYVVRKLTTALLVPLVAGVVWFALLAVLGADFPTVFLIALVIYIVAHTALNLERVRVRPAGRIPWEHIQSVTYRGPHAVAVKLKPDSPLPKGVRGMIDGEVTLPARGIELDQARLDQAVRAYAEAGGSFSGRPGSGASSSGMSAGGPSG